MVYNHKEEHLTSVIFENLVAKNLLKLRVGVLERSSQFAEILDLRSRAWAASYPSSQVVATLAAEDSYEQVALHFQVTHNEKLIATGRLTQHEDASDIVHAHLFPNDILPKKANYSYFSKLVVDPAYVGMGLTSLLDDARMVRARELGSQAIVALPIGKRVLNFQKRGFVKVGDSLAAPSALKASFPIMFLDLQGTKIESSTVFLS